MLESSSSAVISAGDLESTQSADKSGDAKFEGTVEAKKVIVSEYVVKASSGVVGGGVLKAGNTHTTISNSKVVRFSKYLYRHWIALKTSH